MQLEDAIILACQTHKGQVDLGGAPYILHPLRVMLQMSTDEEREVAVLHDVQEDSLPSLEAHMRLWDEGVTYQQFVALRLLTRVSHEPYKIYIERLAVNRLARKVKLADLEDNLDVTRLVHPLTEADTRRIEKYEAARYLLLHTKESL